MTIGERIRERREALGLSMTALGKLCGVSRAAVHQWEAGDTSPKRATLPKVAEALKVSLAWLVSGNDLLRDNVKDASLDEYRVPVVDFVTAGHWTEVTDPYETGGGFEYVGIDFCVSRHVFALEIVGESMAPEFRPGDLVVIDPGLAPRPGDYVVAKLDRDDSATFKRYRERGIDASGDPMIELVPINPDFPSLYIDSQNPGRIVGVMLEHRRRFRRR